jgi:hypothetical protein
MAQTLGGPSVRFSCVLAWLGAALVVSACAQNPERLNTTFLDRYVDSNPTLAAFQECHGFSCSETSRVSLNRAEWSRVVAVFRPSAKDARTERRRIAEAVALMQRLVGTQTGTAVHQWTHKDLQVLPNLSDPTQLDCIDEAVNTWTYMTLMERSGLFRYHKVAQLSASGTLLDPRNTAVLHEINGDHFAIDPSLVDFGMTPPVIRLASWIEHWPPDLAAADAPPSRVDWPMRSAQN